MKTNDINKKMIQGHNKYINNESNNESKLKSDTFSNNTNKSLKYSKGIFGFIFIFVLCIAGFLFTYFYGKKSLLDSFSVSSAIGFFSSLIWLTSRQSFSLKIKYSSRKFWDYMTFKEKRKEKNLVINSLAINNINSFDEYEEYVMREKKNSTITFYFSFVFYSLYFLICIILSFTIV